MTPTTKQDVLNVACNLITKNGSTTTLDVKNELQSLGYFAKQVHVHAAMEEIADQDKELDYTDSGLGYRIFTVPSGSAIITVGTSASKLGSKVVPAGSPAAVIANVGKGGLTIGKKGDWEVNATTSKVTLWFPATMTRDEVRRAFVKANKGTKFVDTRSRIVK